MNAIVVFVAATYSLSIALSLIVGLTGGHESALAGLAYVSSTFLPAVAVLIVTATLNEQPRHARRRESRRARLGGTVEGSCSIGRADGLYHTPLSWGWGVLTVEGLGGRIALNAMAGLAIVSVLTFFEEIGWRAWLLPRLRDRLGARSAVVVTAFIWALWHVPFQLSGVQHIDGISPARLASSLPVGIMIAGLILGWLWLRTESIWLVSIAHGALNNWGQYAFKYMKDTSSIAKDVLALGGGFLALFAVAVVLLWCGVSTDAGPPGDIPAVPTSQ